jgi:hypothetical protein
MRYLIPVLFLPTLAQAHAGAHLHPHGIDVMWLVVVGLLTLAGGYFLGWGRK